MSRKLTFVAFANRMSTIFD